MNTTFSQKRIIRSICALFVIALIVSMFSSQGSITRVQAQQLQDETSIIFDNLTQVSPNEKYIAYVTAKNFEMANSAIWLGVPHRPNSIILVTGDTNNNYWVTNPVWSPDSEQIAYIKVITGGDKQNGKHLEIWVINLDGSNNHKLTDTPLFNPTLGDGGKTELVWTANNDVEFLSQTTSSTKTYAVGINTLAIRKVSDTNELSSIVQTASFVKTSPANGTTGIEIGNSLKLSWSDPGNVYKFKYCYYSDDPGVSNFCDLSSPGTWQDADPRTATTVTITPSSAHPLIADKTYQWQVGAKKNDNSFAVADGGVWTFKTTTSLHTISGNAAVSGATLSYTDGSAKTVTADSSGNYSFSVSYNWSGTVTPSKAGYNFSPASRTYANVKENQTSQNYTATPTFVTISGNTGIGGATLSYTDGTAKTATADASGNYSFTVSYNWSGTVAPSKTGYFFTPPNRPYTNVLTNQTGQNYTATLITYTITGNAGDANVKLIYLDGTVKTATADGSGNYSITIPYGWTGSVTPWKSGKGFTPPNRSYTYVLNDQFSQNYTASPCPTTDVTIAGTLSGSVCLTSGQSTRQNYDANNGPAKINNIGTAKIIAAERVNYFVGGTVTSYAEMMGLPDGQLDTTYWFPWYKNDSQINTQLRIGNVSGSEAHVHVYIAGAEMSGSPYTLTTSGNTQGVRLSYAANAGPVKIVSDQNIVASERVNYLVGGAVTSYAEMMGLPDGQLDTTYWFPWYKNDSQINTQLRIGNVSGSEAHVHVYIAGAEVSGSPYTLTTTGETQSLRLSYAANGGPVKIESDQNIVVSERVNYFVGGMVTSYAEMMGLPDGQLDTTYWFPWYKNDSQINTQLRIGNVSSNEAHVHVYIGTSEMAGSPYTLTTTGETQSLRLSYAANDGPVKIVSDQNIVVTERVNYFVNGAVTSYAEMMGLPNLQLDTTYWFPWYKNDSQINTQLRFAVP